jgi:osmotically-inducible protein OsmY
MSIFSSRFLVVVAITLTIALSGCAAYNKCGFGGCPGDAQIRAKVEAQLAQHPEIEPNAITVQTANHKVYLYGLVSSSLEIDEAQSLASNVAGVTEVVSSVGVSN